MSRLDTLVRLHRWQLDERRRRVAELDGLAERTRGRVAALDASLAQEAAIADRGEGRESFGAYASSMRERRRKLDATLATLSAELAEAETAVSEAFQELKKLELARDARDRRERVVLARREQAQMDEIAARRRSG